MEDQEISIEHGPVRRLAGPWADWRRKRFWLLAAFVAYSLLGFLAAPPLIRWVAVNGIEETGRSASLGKVTVNPWTLTILAEDAEVRDTDGEVIIAYDEYFWNFQVSSLFRWAWTFKEIRLSGLFLNEERFDGLETRFTRLVDSFAAAQGAAEPADRSLPRLIIGEFRLLEGRLRFTDRVANDFQGTLGPISIEAHDLRTMPDHSGLHSVAIRTASGGLVEWRGSLQAVPFESRGHLSLRGQGLDDAFRWADHYLPFQVLVDGAEIDLDYEIGLRDEALFIAVDQLQARFEDNRIRADDAAEDVLATRAVTFAGGMLRWPEGIGRIGAIDIEGLELHAGLAADGSPDLLALIPEWPEDTAPQRESAPLVLELGTLRVPGATIHLTDRTHSPPVQLSLVSLQLEVRDFDNRDGTTMPVTLETDLSSGGQISYRGGVTLFPGFGTAGRLEMQELQLPVLQPYVQPMLRIQLEAGGLDLKADFEHGPQQAGKLAGELGVRELLVHDDRRDERLLAWDAMRLDRFELDLSANRLASSEWAFQGLFGRLHIAEDLSTNIAGLVVEAAEGAAPGPIPELQLGGLSLENAALDFSDYSLPLPFDAAIRQLNGGLSILSSTSSEPSAVSLEGQVDEFGLVRIDGQLNPLSPTDLADIGMTFRNLELASLTPYTVQFAGYRIDDGRMDLDLEYRLDQGQLAGENRVVIRDIQLGEKVDHPDAGSLPLGLAVALLSDAEGVIDLDVPVEGDMNDPEFRIGGVVMQALGNLITKVVTAPFRLLGGLVGIDSEEFGTLNFAAGRADLSPPDREQLVKLGEAMLQRPELIVEVGGVYAPAPDGQALAESAVQEQVERRGAELPIGKNELDMDHERRVLESLVTEQAPGADLAGMVDARTGPAGEGGAAALDLPAYLADLRVRLAAAQPIGEAELRALAEARARAALSVLQQSQPGAAINAVPGPISLVETEDPLAIPLELGVSAGQ